MTKCQQFVNELRGLMRYAWTLLIMLMIVMGLEISFTLAL